MKYVLKIFILVAGFVIYLNANSFASVDAAVYGGYVFDGMFGQSSGSLNMGIDLTGPQFGLKGHYNLQLTPTLDLGIGAFFQYASYTVDYSSAGAGAPGDMDGKRMAAGLDLNFIFAATSEVYPYIRVTYSLYDNLKFDDVDVDVSGDFKGFGFGTGVEYAINPNIRVFGEFMYERPSFEEIEGFDLYITAMSVNAGLKYIF